ncbi:MAG: VanZ family protein, partial [Acidobacteriota bacterium]
VASNPSLQLDFPFDEKTLLVLGNSIYGNGPWHGTVSGLALIDRELQPESVASLYRLWIENKSFAETEKENPSLLYLFNESEKSPIKDRITGTAALLIPDNASPLTKQFLEKSLGDPIFTGSLLHDVLVNLIGFVPLGFFFIAVLAQTEGTPRTRAVFYSVLFCFSVSLAIELFQAWVPSRSSQLLDLLLNTAGGYAGAFLYKKQFRWLRLLIGE